MLEVKNKSEENDINNMEQFNRVVKEAGEKFLRKEYRQ